MELLAHGSRATPDTHVTLRRFEKVDQLKQEMRRKKELERRLRLGDASKGDEDAAEPDAVSQMLAHFHLMSPCSCGFCWVFICRPAAQLWSSDNHRC
jgi:hypothetical protein